MTSYNLLYFLYGASIMFHLMMALLFSYKRRASLNIYVSTLMLVTAAQYAKNLALIGDGCYDSALESLFSSSIDLFTMPLYAIVLIEACRPGWLNWWRASLLYLPFLVLMTVSLAYPEPLVFDVIHISSFVYGVVFLSWSLCEVPRFERTLMEEFSYEKYINFNWLRGIIVLFFCILLLWIYDSVTPVARMDAIYLIGSLVVWAVACFFFYRQARVISIVKAYESADSQSVVAPLEADDEALASVATSLETDIDTDTDLSGTPTDEQSVQQEAAFAERMHLLFERDHVYLNPRLRLTELAALLGTNRTYLSQYINQCCDTTFYDFVNDYRIHHAKLLLHSTDDTLDTIATKSGFNSLSTFRRAFQQREGKSPIEFRASNGKNSVSNS